MPLCSAGCKGFFCEPSTIFTASMGNLTRFIQFVQGLWYAHILWGTIILVVIFTLVFGTLFIVYATQEGSKVFQGLCVIITLLLVVVITSFVTVVFTKLDDQSYYAAAVQILIDESIDSLWSPSLSPYLGLLSSSQGWTGTRLSCSDHHSGSGNQRSEL